MPELQPTGHNTFDRIAADDYVYTGNAYTNIQVSGYIRAFKDVTCNGFPWKEGELQAADLKSWKTNRHYRVPTPVFSFISEVAVEKPVILYMFYHWRRKELVVHGFAVTSGNEDKHELLRRWVTGPTHKSWNIMDECCRAIGGAK
jgi:hypothetical protein